MRGHQALIKLRIELGKSGQFQDLPEAVWISHAPTKFCVGWERYDWKHPEIEILPTELPASLDLRFVYGLRVHVSGCRDYAKAKRLHDALVAAKASRVITS